MNRFTFTKLGRTLMLAAVVAVGSVCWLGCGGDDDDSSGGNGDKANSGGAGVSWNNTCGKDGTASSCKQKAIGGTTWMTENLNYQTPGSWCYLDSPDSCAKYGRLYTWSAARTACPSGWHLPSRNEWGALAIAAGGRCTPDELEVSDNDYGTCGLAGKALKSKSGWYNNLNGTDTFGFSAQPGGRRLSDGGFDGIGGNGFWWTDTEASDRDAYRRLMAWSYGHVDEQYDDKSNAFSVRCVQDT